MECRLKNDEGTVPRVRISLRLYDIRRSFCAWVHHTKPTVYFASKTRWSRSPLRTSLKARWRMCWEERVWKIDELVQKIPSETSCCSSLTTYLIECYEVQSEGGVGWPRGCRTSRNALGTCSIRPGLRWEERDGMRWVWTKNARPGEKRMSLWLREFMWVVYCSQHVYGMYRMSFWEYTLFSPRV
jgi:hypothetical protein